MGMLLLPDVDDIAAADVSEAELSVFEQAAATNNASVATDVRASAWIVIICPQAAGQANRLSTWTVLERIKYARVSRHVPARSLAISLSPEPNQSAEHRERGQNVRSDGYPPFGITVSPFFSEAGKS